MPAQIPESDLSRTQHHEPDMDFPDFVEISLMWGAKARSYLISADEFFGRGGYGAPLPAEAIVQHINRLRRMGKPE